MTDTIDKDDPLWALKLCNVIGDNGAWSLEPTDGKKKGEGITILHPDTGYTKHPELVDDSRIFMDHSIDVERNLSRNFREGPIVDGKLLNASDLLDGKTPGHGTNTSSVIVAGENSARDNGFPNYSGRNIIGIAPLAKLIPCRVCNFVILSSINDHIDIQKKFNVPGTKFQIPYTKEGFYEEGYKYINKLGNHEQALINAIYHAIDPKNSEIKKEIGVISMSLAVMSRVIGRESVALNNALKSARENGIVVCAAAGQIPKLGKQGGTIASFISGDMKFIAYPAQNQNTIAVAACDHTYRAYNEGFYGPAIDITAPGVNVWRAETVKNDDGEEVYTSSPSTGTSYATALTAGACALWQAYHGRNYLITKYDNEKKYIFDAFKWCLYDSCDKDINGWHDDEDHRGKGFLNVKSLLECSLPDKAILKTADNRSS